MLLVVSGKKFVCELEPNLSDEEACEATMLLIAGWLWFCPWVTGTMKGL